MKLILKLMELKKKRFDEVIPSNDEVNIELIGENIDQMNKFKILKKERNVNDIELIKEKRIRSPEEDLIIESENVEILGGENIIDEKEDEESKVHESKIAKPVSNIIKLELLEKDEKNKENKQREKLELISNINELNIEAIKLEKEFDNLIYEDTININLIGKNKKNEFEFKKKNISKIEEEIPEFKRISIDQKKGKMEEIGNKKLEKKPLITLEDMINNKEIDENIPHTNYTIEHFEITNEGNIKPEIELLKSNINEIKILGTEKEEPELEIISNINELIIEGKEKEELKKEKIEIGKIKEKLLKFRISNYSKTKTNRKKRKRIYER